MCLELLPHTHIHVQIFSLEMHFSLSYRELCIKLSSPSVAFVSAIPPGFWSTCFRSICSFLPSGTRSHEYTEALHSDASNSHRGRALNILHPSGLWMRLLVEPTLVWGYFATDCYCHNIMDMVGLDIMVQASHCIDYG